MDGRCDGCRGTTTTTVRLRDGRRLELCDSHARQHASSLRSQGALIVVPPLSVVSANGSVIQRLGRPAVIDPAHDLPQPAGRLRRAWRWLTDLSAQSSAHLPPHHQTKEEP